MDSKVISANNSVGGLIGIAAKQLNYDKEVNTYNNIECNLVVTDLVSTGSFIDMGIGSINNSIYGVTQSPYMNNIYVYNCSYLNGMQVGGIIEEVAAYKLVSSSELSDSSIYTKNNKLTDEKGNSIGNEGLNFGTTRYVYSNGYFPTLKANYSANSYWDSNNLNIMQNKIAIPTRTEEFQNMDSISLNSVSLNISSYNLEAEELPDIYVYATDVDKINIEFSNVDSNTNLTLVANNNIIIGKMPVTEQVYTFQYDFKTPLEITISNPNHWYTKNITTGDTQNLLSIIGDELLYLKDENLCTNKREIDGKFVNIYENKALDIDGNIYNITTMDCLKNGNIEIKLLENQVPITEYEYNNKTIQTFSHCSKVIQDEKNYSYKKQQMFVKNGSIYVIDGNLNSIGDSIIIDSYNNKQYEAVLGTEGVIYDLLTEIHYPENFENKNIIAMTNNINNDNEIVLVYYSNGRVCGFNYITGEVVYDNNIGKEDISLVNYIMSNFSISDFTNNINKADYEVAQTLVDKLKKVSVDEAIKELKDNNIEIDGNNNNSELQDNVSIKNDADNNKDSVDTENSNTIISGKDTKGENQYITTYDSKTQSYVVYSTKELLKTDSPKTQTENEKISSNSELITYYTNISTSMQKMKNIGVIIISLIMGSICIILIILYKKNK